MLKYCELIADRLLEVIVPRVDAGACPCQNGEVHCSLAVCATFEQEYWFYRHRLNCHCQVIDKVCHPDCNGPR
jgi:hypothetical protein